eukprot:4161785-Ditylum_brightwellii.AAC.1
MRHPFTIGRWKEYKAYKGHKEAVSFIQKEESWTTKRQRTTQAVFGSFFSKKSKTMCNKDSNPGATANMKSASFKTNATSHCVGAANGISNQDKPKQLAVLSRYG